MDRFNSARRLGVQLILVISAGLVFLASYFIISDYHKHISSSEEETLKRLETVAKTIALNVDGNQHEYLINQFDKKDAIRTTAQNELYYFIHDYMKKVQETNDIETDIYTLFYDSTEKARGNTPFYFGITSGDRPYFRHPYENYPPQLEAHFTEGSRIPVFTDEHGTWLSYFAPIRNSQGKVVAVVQVDKNFEEFLASSRKEAITGVVISLVIFLFIGFLLVFFVRKIIRMDEIKSQRLESLHEKIMMQHKDITDSINYSERIQKAIVPNKNMIRAAFNDSFLFYKARDVISGDFPWIYNKKDGSSYIAAVDCTGHGVPGCMLSFIGYFLLNDVVSHKEVTDPATVLCKLNQGVVTTLKQEKNKAPMDGMDVALCHIDRERNVLQFAGAHRPLYLLRNEEVIEFKGDRQSVGGIQLREEGALFTNHSIEIRPGDAFFIFSDGLQDQFGGPAEKKKKYSSKRIREVLTKNYNLPMQKLQQVFEDDFQQWMGETGQVDDVLLIGLKF